MTEQQIREIVKDELGKMIQFSQRLTRQTLKAPEESKLAKCENLANFLLECVSVTVLLVLITKLLIKLFT